MKIYKKEKVSPAMWVMKCPKCGKICASASERSCLPDWIICDCEEQIRQDMTPVLKQYFDMKGRHPDRLLLFRCGDFYEAYNEDAEDCGRILGIIVRKYHETETNDVKVAAFPHYALDSYLPKLIRAGRRIAICDQLEDPKLTRKKDKRGINELIQPNRN